VFGDGQQSRCFCYVLDTVEALVRLQGAMAARGEIFNIGGTEEVTILQLAHRVIETLGSKSIIEFVPYSEAYAPGFDDMRRRKPVVEKLRKVTGFCPQTSLDQIIQRTAEELRL
jgi:UDP-glucose 4-epimerase